MATGADWSCPICREASGNIAYVRSCLHQFCRGCIVRWASKNPSCPLCRQTVHTIIYPAPHDQGFVEMAVAEPSESQSAAPEEEPDAEGPQPLPLVAGFLPETWASFFTNYTEILRPLEMWLNEVLCGACWWDVAFAQGRIVASLCRYGLHEAALARELHPFLQDQTPAFVRQLIEVAADRCGELARYRMDTGPLQAGPGAAASSGTSGVVASPGTSGAVASPGTIGAVASSGTSGVVASSGTSGVVASPGTIGVVASSGTSGVVASPGTIGAVASSGTSGVVASPGTIGVVASSGTSGVVSSPGTSGAVASPVTSGVQEERREGRRQAGARTSGARQSGGCGPGAFSQSGRRRGGGAPESGGRKKAYRRQN